MFRKDRPNWGKVGQLFHIMALSYPTLDGLLEEDCNQVMRKCEIEGVSFTHIPLTGRISFEWKHGTLNFLCFVKYFFNQLRLGSEQVEIFSKPLYYAPSKIWGDRRASLDIVQTLFVYSDVIDDQIVGNSKAMLMGVLPVTDTHGEQQCWQVNPFQYIDIPSSSMPSITMRICTPTWEDVPFMSGDPLCRLHFRGKML